MATEPPSISACIVLYKSYGDLATLTAGLDCQTRFPEELIFCLNGPNDGSRAFLEAWRPALKILEPQANLGFAAGVNACGGASSGDFLFLLNADVVLQPDYLEKCLATLTAPGGELLAGVGGLLLRPAAAGQATIVDSAGMTMQPWLRLADRGAGAEPGFFSGSGEVVVGLCAAALLLRRQALEEVAEDGQWLDEDFFMYKEDQDLCLRLNEVGWQMFFLPEARAEHRRGWAPGARKEIPLALRRHSLKNRYLLLLKHWRWSAHLWRLPFVVCFEIFLLLALLLKEPSTLKAYPMAIRRIPSVWRKRRQWLARMASANKA